VLLLVTGHQEGYARGSASSVTVTGTVAWYEDVNSTGQCRYGHRDVEDKCGGDDYLTNGAPDRANGDTWSGADRLRASVFQQGNIDLKLQVIDRCNGGQVKAESAPLTVEFNSLRARGPIRP
jgi:hypothetical protein